MAIREITAQGIEALNLATRLLQRSRCADPYEGIWEAADIQWSWRTPRDSDNVNKTFWIDENGPVAGIWLTSSAGNQWQIDPIVVPHQTDIEPEIVWNTTLGIIADHPDRSFDVPVANNNPLFQQLAKASGLAPSDEDFTGWMNASVVPAPAEISDGFTLVDRTMRGDTPHPMSGRNGEHISSRLQQCSLYDPSMDLSIESSDGDVAGYSLYWFDPVTRVGVVEPVRVHDDFQRRGLARAMVTHGIDRLIAKGAERIKVSWETEAAGALYLGVGFQQQSETTWYSTPTREKTTD